MLMSTLDLEYVVPVVIGTPGVTLNLDFDTGSSDLWVWSSEIRTSSTKGHVCSILPLLPVFNSTRDRPFIILKIPPLLKLFPAPIGEYSFRMDDVIIDIRM
jgi:Eukaryotic aspartyl protease